MTIPWTQVAESIFHPSSVGASLLYDLIRPQQRRRWDAEAQRLGGLEVDDELELRGLLDGKVGRLGAPEDTVDEGGDLSIQLCEHRPIRHESSRPRHVSPFVHCRDTALCCPFDDHGTLPADACAGA